MPWNPDRGSPPRKALLIQLRRIGDAVLVTPSLDALRDAWPDTRLHLLTAAPVPDLFVGDPRLDVVWVRPSRSRIPGLARSLKREDFDVVFDFQSLPWTATLARVTGGWTTGFAKRGRRFLYDRAVALDRHTGTDYAADHKLDLLRAAGIEASLAVPRLLGVFPGDGVWTELPQGPRVVLVPVSLRAHKRWTAEGFAASARRLHRATGAVFVVAGGPGEDAALAAVAARLEGVPHRVRELTRLRDFVSLVSGAALFLGNDNGPRHLALARGVPTLAWFGTQNPTHWTPPGRIDHPVIWDRSRARGRPVADTLRIVPEDPEAVAEEAARLLRGAS